MRTPANAGVQQAIPDSRFSSPILWLLTFLLSDLLTSLTSQFEKSLSDLRALPNLLFCLGTCAQAGQQGDCRISPLYA
ncbi:hypothetical protein RCIA34 [Methanocella arvoryzae MRE50]|uniref:Uncharacterized protein n=1 Tax=Methanocella arvoryzae (strain DSM 22066 / NBRC 105507 / MRE50) TaxID=351160 RepID=Q0W686_METAR|nr:hypothetical protein orf15 [uncultured archaeon]CAJ36107.1 hypothetical protein RCIA34 [Methanocella arvoryzae MRE50]